MLLIFQEIQTGLSEALIGFHALTGCDFNSKFIPSSASGGIAASSLSTGQNFQMQNNYGGVGQLRAQFIPRSASSGGIAASSSSTGQNFQHQVQGGGTYTMNRGIAPSSSSTGQNFQHHHHQVQSGGGSTHGGINGTPPSPALDPEVTCITIKTCNTV